MIGIYKITNKINNHCYIGQSTHIERRWRTHKEEMNSPKSRSTHNYPLYCAFRKYGIENFDFQVIEECSQENLNEHENYWIHYYNPEYNQTMGGDYQVVPQKLTFEQVQEIKDILINDQEGIISHKELAQKYGVHKDTIRDINVGRTWLDQKLNYPLHYSKFDPNKPEKIQHYCVTCGKPINKNATRCCECAAKNRRYVERPSRDDLKKMIRTTPFTKIGEYFGVSDNSIRKWCDQYHLPRRTAEIKNYSDEEWNKI